MVDRDYPVSKVGCDSLLELGNEGFLGSFSFFFLCTYCALTFKTLGMFGSIGFDVFGAEGCSCGSKIGFRSGVLFVFSSETLPEKSVFEISVFSFEFIDPGVETGFLLFKSGDLFAVFVFLVFGIGFEIFDVLFES